MISNRYVVRPKADQDLDHQAHYYAMESSSELGHRFLVAAHDTFALLSSQPQMGWRPRFRHANLSDLRIVRVIAFEKILVLYRPFADGVEVLRVVHGSRNLRAMLRRAGT